MKAENRKQKAINKEKPQITQVIKNTKKDITKKPTVKKKIEKKLAKTIHKSVKHKAKKHLKKQKAISTKPKAKSIKKA